MYACVCVWVIGQTNKKKHLTLRHVFLQQVGNPCGTLLHELLHNIACSFRVLNEWVKISWRHICMSTNKDQCQIIAYKFKTRRLQMRGTFTFANCANLRHILLELHAGLADNAAVLTHLSSKEGAFRRCCLTHRRLRMAWRHLGALFGRLCMKHEALYHYAIFNPESITINTNKRQQNT